MRYVTPEVALLAPAVAGIQGGCKGLAFVWDMLHVISVGGYEADE